MEKAISEFSLEEEVKNNFLITTDRKKIWKKQMEIALEVKRICDKYSIHYFIIWGTLLGAVRHKGYIPWDDDFDIGFLRKDYEKFCSVAKDEVKHPYFLQNAYTDTGYYMGYSRLRNSNTTGIIIDNIPYSYNNGIFVDLYPLDTIIDCRFLRKIQYKLRDVLNDLCYRYYSDIRKENDKKYMRIVRKLIAYPQLCKLTEMVYRIGNLFNGSEVGLVYHKILINTYHFSKKYAYDTVPIAFENCEFNAPLHYKKVLNEIYGDYTQLPPISKRGRWHEGQIVFEPDIPFVKFIRSKNNPSYNWRKNEEV